MTHSTISCPDKRNKHAKTLSAILLALAMGGLTVRAGYCASVDLARSSELPESEMTNGQTPEPIAGPRQSARGAYVVQIGHDNDVSITQSSDANLARILQSGSLNQAVMQQSAGSPPAKITQYGSGTFAKLIQY